MSKQAKRPVYLVRVGVAHKRVLIAAAIGLIAGAIVPATAITRILVGWDVGVLIYLVAVAVVMTRCASVAQMKANAAAQDEGEFAVLFLTVVAGMASVIAIFAELATLEHSARHYAIYAALAIGTVVLSWTLIHTIFALRYAHEFYGEGRHKNGLRFPGEGQPDYWDFVYFAFVIGMTFQVSDVAVVHKSVRRHVVVHGVLSFFFATAFIAMSVNIAAGIIQK